MVSTYLAFLALLATAISGSEALIRFNNVALADQRSLGSVLKPLCTVQDDVANCCVSLRFPKPTKICANFVVSKNELKVKAALAVNDKQVVEKELSVGNICYPVGPLVACVDIYYVAINLEQKRVETCVKASLNNLGKELASRDLKCVQYENGKFSKTTREPSQ